MKKSRCFRLWRAALCLVTLAGAAVSAQAQGTAGVDVTKSLGDTANADAKELKGWVRRTDADAQRWRDNRFGMFIHFGLYSYFGGHWNGREIGGAAEWIKPNIPTPAYKAVMKDFSLEKFDAKEWVDEAKRMGARYITFTTKHHDGFCLWDTKYTDYKITNTAFKRDLLRELVDAAKAEGIDILLYYSIIDWDHPDFMARLPKTPEEIARYDRYLQFMKDQCKELLTEYGDVKGLWFDGRWDPSYKQRPEIGKAFEAWLREVKPGIVLADRVRAYDSFADFNAGYERKLPDTRPPTDWEACLTMRENSWGYHRTWSGNGWKAPRTLVRWLAHCAGMGGNLMINIGPRGDGSLDPRETERQRAVGRWMKSYGDAIYGTDGLNITPSDSKVKPGDLGMFATIKGKTVNLILTEWPDTDKLRLPGLKLNPVKAVLRQPDGTSVPLEIIEETLTKTVRGPDGKNKRESTKIKTVLLPLDAPDPYASVVTLTVE